jgi:hypothetical protein
MSLVLPPLSPGYKTYPNSGIIVIAAGSFMAGARGGLNTYSDAAAPGPSQVQDAQSAVSAAAALDTLEIDMDTVGVVSGRKYLLFLTYLVLDTGSIEAHACTVLHDGTVLEADAIDGGQTLFVSGGPYGMEMGADSFDAGTTLKSSTGQTLKVRAWHAAGSGSVILDCIFLMPTGLPTFGGSAHNVMWQAANDPPYTWPVHDGWKTPGSGLGWNGMFACMDDRGDAVESQDTSAPDPSIFPDSALYFNGGSQGIIGTTAPQRMLATVRCTNPAAGVGKITAVYGDYPSQANGHTYNVPVDGSVYMLDLDQDTFDPFDADMNFGISMWAPDADQFVRSCEGFVYEVDAPTGPRIAVRFRAAN